MKNMTDENRSGCPLTARDAYELKFEMEQTRDKLKEHSEKMELMCIRIGKFEQLYYEGRGVAIGMKLGGVAVVAAIMSVLAIIWSFLTGKIQFSDIFKIL